MVLFQQTKKGVPAACEGRAGWVIMDGQFD
jgi:hypothetical protein